jgi:hypothetical protein
MVWQALKMDDKQGNTPAIVGQCAFTLTTEGYLLVKLFEHVFKFGNQGYSPFENGWTCSLSHNCNYLIGE